MELDTILFTRQHRVQLNRGLVPEAYLLSPKRIFDRCHEITFYVNALSINLLQICLPTADDRWVSGSSQCNSAESSFI